MLWIRHGRYYKLKHIQTQNSHQVFHIKLQKDIPILYHEKDLRIFFFLVTYKQFSVNTRNSIQLGINPK